jgi:hypothetical protein
MLSWSVVLPARPARHTAVTMLTLPGWPAALTTRRVDRGAPGGSRLLSSLLLLSAGWMM